MGVRRNAALYAGLMGSLSLLAPVSASALTMSDVSTALDSAFASPSVAFLCGLVGGAAASAAVCGSVALVVRGRRRAAVPEELDATSECVPHVASAGEGASDSLPRGRHFRRQDEPAPAPAKAVPDASGSVESSGNAPASHGPTHAALDYEDIAENYVNRSTFRDRMARRAQGVAATLRERLDASKMDGVPVIARADGSVGDVGTSWWEASVGADSIISDSGFAAEDDLAIPSDFTDPAARPVSLSPGLGAPSIAERVAFVDEGVYPERRTVDDLSLGDDWASALRSLDERLVAEVGAPEQVAFVDAVGGLETLDEPDNLEPATAFIPFKPLAGHPEVVDAETYVDHLIEEEFSKSSSKAVRRTSRRFLRVLEGGTGTTTHLGPTGETGVGYVGKHFSTPLAAEA